MNKPVTVLTLLLVLGICLTAIAPIALADKPLPVPPIDETSSPGRPSAIISWTPAALTVQIAAGEEQIVHASFKSSADIQGAKLVVSFPLNRAVSVPDVAFDVREGADNDVALTVTLPGATTGSAAMAGTVQVVAGGRTYAMPLVVTVRRTTTPPPIDWTPDRVLLSVPNAPADPAVTPTPTTAVVHFTTQVAIDDAFLRITPMLDRVLDLDEVGPIDLRPGTTYELQLTAHLPTGMDADAVGTPATEEVIVDGPGRGPVKRVVSGEIQVYKDGRVYPHNLPVRVEFSPAPKQPVIKWSPPVATMFVPASAAQTKVVTLTSNLAIAGATLQVKGAIEPFVTAALETTTPPAPLTFDIAANTPVRIVLTATPPASAVINRPYMGAVVVTGADGTVYRHELKVLLMWRRAATP